MANVSSRELPSVIQECWDRSWRDSGKVMLILCGSYVGFMEREKFIIRHHHERVDGGGYPDGIGGEDLDQLTKILTVADSYDAMTSYRNYRRNKNMGEAIVELNNCAGSQFDKEIVDVFTDQLSRFGPQYLAVSAGSDQLGHNNLIN